MKKPITTDAEVKKSPTFKTWLALWKALLYKGNTDVGHIKNLIDDFAWAVTEQTKAQIVEKQVGKTDFFDPSVQDYFPAYVIPEAAVYPMKKPIHRKKKESVA